MTIMPKDMTRRRLIGGLTRIAAGGALAGLVGLPPLFRHLAREGRLYRWRGVALGGTADLWLEASDRAAAAELVHIALAEKSRLETIFSLYHPDSLLVRLNRAGRLDHPPAEMLELLALARRIHGASNGAFDPTIQPLYRLFAERRGRSDPAALRRVGALVGFEMVAFDEQGITFARPGMALSFNGIAQGFISDAVALRLASAGARAALVEFGEIRALALPPGRSAWPISLETGDKAETGSSMALAPERALAVSATTGTRIAGRVGHILDPRTRRPVETPRRVAVEAASAALADGLSTALSVLGREGAKGLARAFDDIAVRWLD